jgi:hypothetical protein
VAPAEPIATETETIETETLGLADMVAVATGLPGFGGFQRRFFRRAARLHRRLVISKDAM